MNVSVQARELSKSLKILSIAQAKKNNPEILHGVLAQADERLVLTKTDLSISIRAIVDAQISQAGAACIDYLQLQKISDKTDREIQIDATKETAIVKGAGKYMLPLLPVEDFPRIQQSDKTGDSIDLKGLQEAIRTVFYAVGEEGKELSMQGVYFHNNRIVATDGVRLAITEYEHPLNHIIPSKAINALLKLSQDKVNILSQENAVFFMCEGIEIITSIINTKYPDYERVMPQYDLRFTVNKESLILNIEALLLNPEDNRIPLCFKVSGSELYLFIHNTTKHTEAQTKMPCISEGDIMFYVMPVYILDALRALSTEEANIYYAQTERGKACLTPLLITPTSGSDKHIVMPMRSANV